MSLPFRCLPRTLCSRLGHQLSLRGPATSATLFAPSSSQLVAPQRQLPALALPIAACQVSTLVSPTSSLLTKTVQPTPLLFLQHEQPVLQQTRGLAGIRKKKKKQTLSKKKAHEKKMKAKRVEQGKRSTEDAQKQDESEVAVQHREWVDFQKSIAVEGFETGQLTEVIAGHTRNRQMRAQKRAQQRLEARILERKKQDRSIKSGEYQALSYSPEETARLLERAKSFIPKREGPRRTRHRRRMARRHWLVRQIHRKKQKQMKAARARKVLERKKRKETCLAIIANAPNVIAADRDYQFTLFKRWAANMGLDVGQDPRETAFAQEEQKQQMQ